MEAVEDHRGLRHRLPEDRQVRPPHLAADDADWARPAPPQPGEKPLEGPLVAILPGPDDAPAGQGVDEREVLLALPATHFVNADHVQAPPPAVRQTPQDRGLDRGGDRLPVHAEVRGHTAPVQLPGQRGHRPGQGMGHPLPLRGPGDPLHPQAAGGTPAPVGRIDKLEGLVAQAQILPPAFRAAGPGHLGGGAAALPAAEPPAGQPLDVGHQAAVGLLLDVDHSMGFHSERLPDKRFQAHRSLSSSLRVASPEEDSRVPRCASTFQSLRAQTLLG